MGFAAMLAAAGLLTLRTGVFARWIGIVALVGAVGFVITFFALIQGTERGQPLRLRLSSWHPGARDLVDRHERREIPRGGDHRPLVQPARLELALLDPQLRRDLRVVAPHLLDEVLCVLAADEHLELDAEREVGLIGRPPPSEVWARSTRSSREEQRVNTR